MKHVAFVETFDKKQMKTPLFSAEYNPVVQFLRQISFDFNRLNEFLKASFNQ